MKISKIFWRKMIPALIIAAVTFIMSVLAYLQIIHVEEESCWDRLRNATESTAQKIETRITDNINFLHAVSDSYILKNHLNHEEEVAKYLNSVMKKTIFERIDVILPGNNMITQTGKILHTEGKFTYDELVEKGIHISQRDTNPFSGREVIYCFNPIYSYGGDVVGLLCGTLDCEALGEIFEVFTYKGESQFFLIDCSNGDYIIDNWHSSLGNIYDLGTRTGLDGNETVDMMTPIINRESGRIAFISQTNNRPSYQYYTPIDGFNWELCVAVQEEVVFANAHNLRNFLLYVGVVEVILIVVYLIWNIATAYSASLSEEKARKLELTRVTNEAKARFISNMSHDIKTPLNGIVGMLHIIKNHRDDKERVDDCLDKIEISTQYLTTLTSDMLDINEIENDKLAIENSSVNLNELAEKLDVMIGPKAVEANVQCQIDCSKIKNPYVLGSAVHIQRVLVNLISNAIKYRRGNNSYVWVTFEEDENNVYRFIVKDNGIGMSEEFQQNMYNAFAQEMVTARSDYQGYGLGLTIVHRLVEKMNGKIEVDSEKGKGCTFTVTLTLARDTDHKFSKEQPVSTDLNGVNILLVEDNEFNMEIAEVILTDAGAKITTATNGKEAVDIFNKSDSSAFDLILMDIMMPEMNGYEATKAIRAMERYDAKSIPIFAMTANTFTEEIERCKEAGMNEHIAKPVNIDNLINMVAKYCKKFN